MLTAANAIGLLAFVVIVFGAAYLLQRLDTAMAGEGTETVNDLSSDPVSEPLADRPVAASAPTHGHRASNRRRHGR